MQLSRECFRWGDEESDDEDDEERAARYGESGSEDEVIEGESGSDDDDADDEQDLARITKRSCHVAQEDADDEDGDGKVLVPARAVHRESLRRSRRRRRAALGNITADRWR